MTNPQTTLELTHFGHACVLVEAAGSRVLIDPGSFTELPTDLPRVDAVLITHDHFDHIDASLVARVLAADPDARLYAPASVALDPSVVDASRVVPVTTGETIAIGGLSISIVGGTHALIHDDVPQIENVGYYFEELGLLHPGDEFIVPDADVRVLCAPISGPWQSLADAVDYVRAVDPAIAVPIHEGMLARPAVYLGYVDRLKPSSTTVVAAEVGVPVTL